MTSAIDLFGWDTVFAIPFDQANQAIKAAKSTPPSFNYTDQEVSVTISGAWDDWQLTTGGAGQDLHMVCPIKSGSATYAGESSDLADSSLTIELKLNDLPDPSAAFTDPTAKKGTGTAMVWKPKIKGTHDDPAVSVVASDFPHVSGLLKTALPQIFATYLSANLEGFNHTFSVLMVNEKADKDDYQWLKPTASGYACADSPDSSLAKSTFAVLCMTDNHPAAGNQYAVDARILAKLGESENSAFGISGAQVLRHIFWPGAVATIQGSRQQDFHITNDNLSLKNNNRLTWGDFELEDGKRVSPIIKPANFQMTLEAGQVYLTITDASFKWPSWHGPGDIEVHMTMEQYVQLGLTQKKDGNYVIVPKNQNSVKNVTAQVTVSKAVQIFDICVGIAGSIAGGVLGGVLGSAFDAAATVATESATEGSIQLTEELVEEALEEADEQAIQAAEEDAATAASEAAENAGNPGFLQRFTSSIAANKWKIFGGALGTMIGAQPGLISEYMVLIAKNDLATIPPFDTFALNCTGATQFPHTDGWDLKSAELRGPLVIGGDLKS